MIKELLEEIGIIEKCIKDGSPVIKSNNPLRYRIVNLLLNKRKKLKGCMNNV